MLEDNQDNHHINQKLRTAGIGLKIGKVGKAEIINHIMGTSQFSIFSDALNGWVDLLLEMFV